MKILWKYLKSLNDHDCGQKYSKVTCPSCSKQVSRTNYARHIKSHAVIKFKCDHCKSLFATKEKKEKHMKVHVKHTCMVCGKNFPRPSTLEKHTKLHQEDDSSSATNTTDENSLRTGNTLKCKVCKMEISSITKMTQHMHKRLFF